MTPVREKKYELQRKRVRYRLPAEPSASSLAAHNLASEGLCGAERTLLHSGGDNRCFVRGGQDKKQGVGGEIIIGKGRAFGACRCWKEDDLLLQCPRWHLATFPEPRAGGRRSTAHSISSLLWAERRGGHGTEPRGERLDTDYCRTALTRGSAENAFNSPA